MKRVAKNKSKALNVSEVISQKHGSETINSDLDFVLTDLTTCKTTAN